MQTATKVSLEEFVANPDPHYYDFHELHDGEIVEVTIPSKAHVKLQRQLARTLESLLGAEGPYEVYCEFFYMVPREARRADAVVILGSRWSDAHPNGAGFFGAPNLVVEILSPVTKALDLNHIRRVCLRSGASQFWAVDPLHRSVTVYESESTVQTELELHDSISLAFLPGCSGSLAVKALFP